MKFSIITPVYNGEKYLAETIGSVFSQKGDFEIEYIIIDGGSTDNTVEIIKKYAEKYPIKWISEKDDGMYDAINKGFKMTTGDIYAYINSDDIYLPNAFQIIAKTLKKYPEINWLKGTTSNPDKKLNIVKAQPCYIYIQKWIKRGIYGRNAYFIHQESVFWKKELWDKIEEIPVKYKLAGDYWLWINFAKYEKLWTIKSKVSFFRHREGQLSENMRQYIKEQKLISKEKGILNFKIKFYFWLKSKLKKKWQNKILTMLYKILFRNINEEYVDLDLNNKLIIKKTNFYIC